MHLVLKLVQSMSAQTRSDVRCIKFLILQASVIYNILEWITSTIYNIYNFHTLYNYVKLYNCITLITFLNLNLKESLLYQWNLGATPPRHRSRPWFLVGKSKPPSGPPAMHKDCFQQKKNTQTVSKF